MKLYAVVDGLPPEKREIVQRMIEIVPVRVRVLDGLSGRSVGRGRYMLGHGYTDIT
jgi:hypothetical protein